MDHLHEVTDPGHVHDYKHRVQWYDDEDHTSDYLGFYHYGDEETKTTDLSFTGLKVEGIRDSFRKGDETRPRNMHISYIIRIF